MYIRLGYVAMSLQLKNKSPSKTVTVKTYNSIESEEGKRHRLEKITCTNLKNTKKILYYNKAYDIKVYRITSRLVPLATFEGITEWNYDKILKEQFMEIGNIIKENDFRVSAHPDHFTVINTVNENVFEKSLADLDYHYRIFKAMGLNSKKYKLVMHVGGVYGNKEKSMERFVERFHMIPEEIRKMIIIENDDKNYTAKDVLSICKLIRVPMVLDIHHYYCNHDDEKLKEILPEAFKTWSGEYFPPKMHFSSPKSRKQFRHHSDYIDFDSFIEFLKIAKLIDMDFDIMLESKKKDLSLFDLVNRLKETDYAKSVNKASFIV